MTRFYALAFHRFAHLAEECVNADLDLEEGEGFSNKLNLEQFQKNLLSLREWYKDLRVFKGIEFPNEAEFQAYYCLLNPKEVVVVMREASPEVASSPHLRFCLEVYSAMETGNHARFFKLFQQAPFLMGCVMLLHLPKMRSVALEHCWKAYRRTECLDVTMLTQMLHANSEEETLSILRFHDVAVKNKNGTLVADVTANRPTRPSQTLLPVFNALLELKCHNQLDRDIVVSRPCFELRSLDDDRALGNVLSLSSASPSPASAATLLGLSGDRSPGPSSLRPCSVTFLLCTTKFVAKMRCLLLRTRRKRRALRLKQTRQDRRDNANKLWTKLCKVCVFYCLFYD